MGYFAWLCVGLSVFASAEAGAASGPATAAFPPPRPASAAAADSAAAPLPPPPPAPPPAPSTASPAPPTPNYPQAAPVAAPSPTPYAQPYPAYPANAAYPPPGYAYYYPQPLPRIKERFPDNAAVASVPFIDLLLASVSWQNRVSQFLNVGVQAGTYVAGRVRLAANVIVPTTTMTDDYAPSYEPYVAGSGTYARQGSEVASLFYGFGAGIVAVSSPTFVMSPGILFSRTDVSDYGSSLAFALPFEWVTASGLRLGLEFDGGRVFGGKYRESCNPLGGNSCAQGALVTQDRPGGTSIVLQFQVGFGFNHPDPLPPQPGQTLAPYAWPAPQPAPAPSAVPAPE